MRVILIAVVFVLILVSIIGLKMTGNVVVTNYNYDDFAKCLTTNGVKMYGAYWCPHCTNQKQMFGGSWQYVNYIECALPDGGQAKTCSQAGIVGYPTWEFQDGKKISGELSLEQLSQYSNCLLA